MNRPTFQRCARREIPSVAEGGGFEPPVREPVRQFSKLLVSATHPSFQKEVLSFNRGVISLIAGAKVRLFFEPTKYLANFFRKKLFKSYNLIQLTIEVEGVLKGVSLMYVLHPQVIKVSRGNLCIGNLFFEAWSTAMTH